MFWKRRVYLDAAASVPPRSEALQAFARAIKEFGNPSSPHTEGERAKKILEDARRDIARLTEVKPDDIIFTSGATEANALAIFGLGKPGSHLFYLPSAHVSVVENMHALNAKGVETEALPLHEGKIDIAKLQKMLRPTTSLISLDAVCGETGTRWNIREVANVLQEWKEKGNPHVLLHVDASQAPLTEKLSRSHFATDLLTLDASKVGGVRGIGCLIAARTISLTPLYRGGGQERQLRPGTENPALASAFAAALTASVNEREAFVKEAEEVRNGLRSFIETTITNVYLNEGREHVPHILNISLPGRDTDYVVALLNERGYALGTRSACESDSEGGSRAVFAVFGDRERAKTTLRISWSRGIRMSDVRGLERALAEIIDFIDKSKAKYHY